MQPDTLFVSDGGLPSRITQPQPSPLTRAASMQTHLAHKIAELRGEIPAFLQGMSGILTQNSIDHQSNEALISQYHSVVDRLIHMEQTLTELEQSLLESGEMIDRLRNERNQLQALYVIASHMNETLNKPDLLELILIDLMRLVDGERGAIMLKDEDNVLRFEVALQRNGVQLGRNDFIPSRTCIEEVWRTEKPLLINHALDNATIGNNDSIRAQSINAIMCAPLKVNHEIIGIVYVDRCSENSGEFSSSYLDLLAAFCNQAAIALQNANLFAAQQLHNQAIAAMKMYTDSILTSIHSGVMATDNEGRVTRINYALEKLLQIQPEDVFGRPYDQVMSVIEDSQLLERLRATMFQHDVQESVLIKATIAGIPNPQPLTLNVRWSALYDNQRQRLGNVIVVDDLTDLTQARHAAEIFRRYVHPDVVELVTHNPTAAELGGQTREISVIFADIRGSTRLGEGMAPAELVLWLNKYLTMLAEAVFAESGTVTMFQGDALMAIFNAPVDQPDHALRAVRAAWRMHQSIEHHNSTTGRGRILKVGVGIHSGQALVGNIGAQNKLQNFTAIGDVVNCAKRLEELAREGQIILSESTYKFASATTPLKVKHISEEFVPRGKSHPMHICELLGL
jgi:adenylate cyclase